MTLLRMTLLGITLLGMTLLGMTLLGITLEDSPRKAIPTCQESSANE
ncbi:hypothetical protein ACMHYB_01180 [Sorangium sp. So ce1128]